jgi:hypothetical protein
MTETITFALMLLLLVLPAHAQVLCGTPQQVEEQLRETYGETMRGYGIDQRGNHVQLFVAPTGRWTLTTRPPKGSVCLSRWGTEWHIFGPMLPEASHEEEPNG